jgi:hypothetical protein
VFEEARIVATPKPGAQRVPALLDNGAMDAPSKLLDAHGCLSAAGLLAVRNALPGRAPDEAAMHLAGCARCQRRLLSDGAPGALYAGKPRPREPPPPWRAAVVVLAAVLLVLSVLATIHWLRGGG